jgi:hypothetical protein
MVCEETRTSGGTDMVLKRYDGGTIGSVLKPNEYERGLFACWSPDGSFFVYFTELNGIGGSPKIIYQSVEDLGNLGDPSRHKLLADKVPGFYCLYPDTYGKCGALGSGNIGSDYAAFSPLQPGESLSRWLVVAIQKPLPQPSPLQKYKRVLYAIPLLGSASPKEFEMPNDVGYPTFSPDGRSIAFLSIRTPEDPRSQLFVVDFANPKRWKQVTFVAGKKQVYNPRWSN